MSGSCYYDNYKGPQTKTNNEEKGSKYLTKVTRNNNGPRDVKTSIDGIDYHLFPSLLPRAMPTPPITDTEYYRLHDIYYDTDLEFQTSLLSQWSQRAGRLGPWTQDERDCLMRRWYTPVRQMTKVERCVFFDSSIFTRSGSKPAVNALNDESKAVNDGNEDRVDRDEVGSFKNSDGQYDSTLCPKLINIWEIHANRKTPFPRAFADKLLATWLGEESAWTPYERSVFYGADNPAESKDKVCAEQKRRLLDILVIRGDDGAEPLLNGRYVKESEPELEPDDVGDEVYATPLEAEVEPLASAYEKELKRFLASDKNEYVKQAKASIMKNSRLMQLLKLDTKADVIVSRQPAYPQSPFGINFQQLGR